MLCFGFYYIMFIVCCQVFVTCFLKVFCVMCVALFCRVLPRVFWGCLLPAVFVSRHPSFACGGLWCVVGVLVWGGVCLLVTGAAGGVAGITLRWV